MYSIHALSLKMTRYHLISITQVRKLSQRSQPKLEVKRQRKILPRLKIQKRRLIRKITSLLIMKLLQSRKKSQSRMTSRNRKLLQVVIRKLVEIRVMQVMVVRLQ